MNLYKYKYIKMSVVLRTASDCVTVNDSHIRINKKNQRYIRTKIAADSELSISFYGQTMTLVIPLEKATQWLQLSGYKSLFPIQVKYTKNNKMNVIIYLSNTIYDEIHNLLI